jgi:hypothetical protein
LEHLAPKLFSRQMLDHWTWFLFDALNRKTTRSHQCLHRALLLLKRLLIDAQLLWGNVLSTLYRHVELAILWLWLAYRQRVINENVLFFPWGSLLYFYDLATRVLSHRLWFLGLVSLRDMFVLSLDGNAVDVRSLLWLPNHSLFVCSLDVDELTGLILWHRRGNRQLFFLRALC